MDLTPASSQHLQKPKSLRAPQAILVDTSRKKVDAAPMTATTSDKKHDSAYWSSKTLSPSNITAQTPPGPQLFETLRTANNRMTPLDSHNRTGSPTYHHRRTLDDLEQKKGLTIRLLLPASRVHLWHAQAIRSERKRKSRFRLLEAGANTHQS